MDKVTSYLLAMTLVVGMVVGVLVAIAQILRLFGDTKDAAKLESAATVIHNVSLHLIPGATPSEPQTLTATVTSTTSAK